MSNWTSILQSKIYSNIKNALYENLKNKYPNIDFVTTEKNLKEPNFPTVKIRIISMTERGQDLTGQSVNAVNATVQIDVTTDKTEYEAQNIAYEVMYVLKRMMFDINAFPITTKETDVYRSVMRANRIIGGGDKF